MAEGLTLLDVLRRCGCADCRQEHEEAIAEIDRLRSKLAPIIIANAEVAKLNAEQAETIERLRHEFKNFHRLLCERFGYGHDEVDWQRDQLSLIEWIVKRGADETTPPRLEDHENYCNEHGGHLRDSPACYLARERAR